MVKPAGNSGWQRLINAAGFSWKGLYAAFHFEAAFRQELLASLLIIPLAFWLGDTGLERGLLIAVWLLVLITELLNSSIETVVDRIGHERHELAGRAKDVASAAVLIALINAAVVWALILW